MHHKALIPTKSARILALALIAMSLLLAACGRDAPTPTPTPTRTVPPPPTANQSPTASLSPTPAPATPPAPETHHPLVLNQQSPLTTPTSQPQDEPTSTATLFPTPTPTPSATPFPPGPPSKLGLFVGRNDPQLFDLLKTGNVAIVKTLEYDSNFVAEIKAISPETLVVARYTPLPLPDLSNWDPIAAANNYVNLLLPIATEPRRFANIDCWEAYNEPNPTNAEQMASLATFEAERTRLLAEAGIRSCIGNFSTGQPPLELWPAFFPALEAAKTHDGYLALHEYSAPYMWFGSGPHQLQAGSDEGDEGWLTLRYRKVYRHILQPAGLDIPLVITETGVDGQVGNRPGPKGKGWQDFAEFWRGEDQISTIAEGFYVEQLAWYDAEMDQDDYLKGAAIYALAGPQGWASFEIGGMTTEILKQYLAVHPVH